VNDYDRLGPAPFGRILINSDADTYLGWLSGLSDGERKADTDNPRGDLEWERIKQLPKDPRCIAEAVGKVVKVISQLLFLLPAGYEYRIIFMQRPLPEILKSQDEMLQRRGTNQKGGDTSAIAAAFQSHLLEIDKWFAARHDSVALRMQYHRVLCEPKSAAEAVVEFLHVPLNIEAMCGRVDANLYRNRVNLVRDASPGSGKKFTTGRHEPTHGSRARSGDR
jgi:hypothetical protein